MGQQLIRSQTLSGDWHFTGQDWYGRCATESSEYSQLPRLSTNERTGAYIQFTPSLIGDDGEINDETTEQFLRDFMDAFEIFIVRVHSVIPQGT